MTIGIDEKAANLFGSKENNNRRVGNSFLGNLNIRQKIGLLTGLLSIPAILGLGNILLNIDREVQKNQQAVNTFKITESLSQTQQLLGTNYLLFASQAQGLAKTKYTAQDFINNQNKAIATAEQTIAGARAQGLTSVADSLKETISAWDPVFRNAVMGKVTPTTLIPAAQTIFLQNLPSLYGIISDSSGLDQTVQPSSVFHSGVELSNFNHFIGPVNRNLAGRISTTILEAYSSPRLVNGDLKPENAVRAQLLLPQSLQAIAKLTQQLRLVDSEQNDAAFHKSVNEIESIFNFTSKFASDNLLNVAQPKEPISTYLAQLPRLDAAYNSVFSQALKLQEKYHADRLTAYRRQAFILGILVLLLLSMLILLIRNILRSITTPLASLTMASQRLSAGDFSVKVPVISRDELGILARSFNNAAEQLQANELRARQEREQAQRLQGSIGDFLDVTMDIAEGDLTKRGKVTEDVLGNVVDSINLMTEELGLVLRDVQQASASVTGGSRAMLATTEQINQGTQLTATEAERVAEQVQELTAAIRAMAQNAQTSADTARQALMASQQGQEAVTGTLEGMQNVRREVQDIAKRVKGLGDRSLEIQEIVDTIGQIARQTNLLALNAAIEAAGAGEAGGRFTIVADEVRKLADTSGQATARIATLIKSVQSEIQDVVVRVEEGTREVEQGYRVAGTAGERLREIGTLSERSAQLAEQISAATQNQVRGIEQMGQAVAQINTIAQQSTRSVEEGRGAAEQLQQLATQLTNSLSRFRLPE